MACCNCASFLIVAIFLVSPFFDRFQADLLKELYVTKIFFRLRASDQEIESKTLIDPPFGKDVVVDWREVRRKIMIRGHDQREVNIFWIGLSGDETPVHQ